MITPNAVAQLRDACDDLLLHADESYTEWTPQEFINVANAFEVDSQNFANALKRVFDGLDTVANGDSFTTTTFHTL